MTKKSQETTQWHSIKDELPEVRPGSEQIRVLVFCGDLPFADEIGWNMDTQYFFRTGVFKGYMAGHITHWMYLPDPP